MIAGVGSSIVAYLVGSAFGTYGAWALALNQPVTPIGRWVMVLTLGVILAWTYGYFGFAKTIPGDPMLKGALYGVMVWIITLVLGAIFPIVGQFAFKSPLGATLYLSAMLHLIWGGFLGFLYQEKF